MAKAKSHKIKRRETVIIRLGLTPEGDPIFWRCAVSDARQNVTLNGTLADALAGKPGLTVGCHLSNCAVRNAPEFPHRVIYAVFTKSKAYIIDRWNKRGGRPAHCVRYDHSLGRFVDLNDKDGRKKLIRKYPEIVERTFMLRAPQQRPSQAFDSAGKSHSPRSTEERHPVIPYGALRRAREAKLISFAEL